MITIPANQPHFLMDLPVEGLQVIGFEGTEEISALPRFEIRLSTDDPNVDFEQIVNQGAVFTILTGDGTDEETNRNFIGIVSQFSLAHGDGDRFEYRAVLSPRLYLSTLNREYRIFQQKTVPDIVEEMLTENLGLSSDDFEINTRGHSFPERNYCTQYGESDFDFISRLLEEEGLFYYFRYDMERRIDIFVVDFDSTQLGDASPEDTARYVEPGTLIDRGEERLKEIHLDQRVFPGSYTVNDYDPEQPSRPLEQNQPATLFDNMEVYEFGANFQNPDDGQHYSRVRVESAAATHERLIAEGDFRSPAAGSILSIENYWRDDINERRWAILRVEHRGVQPLTGSSAGTDMTIEYGSRFEAIDAEVPYRAPRRTPRPNARGSHTATVVGPSGEPLYIDDMGRIKIHFHWDRHGTTDENSSCWVRVAQDAAGPNYGQQAPPRVGHEVIVDFLDADPDRPIVIGSVYNQESAPSVGSGNKTQHSIKSFGGNSISFEDSGGGEQFNVNATRDAATTIGNDQSTTVTNNRTVTVGVDQTTEVGSNDNTTIGASRSVKVGASDTLNVGSDRSATIGANNKLTVGANHELTIGGTCTNTIGTSQSDTIGAALSQNVGANRTLDIGGAATTTVAGSYSINVGGSLSISAGGTITLSVGGSSVVIGAGDVTVKGPVANVEGTGSVGIKSAVITLNGSGAIQVKGAMITNN